MKACIEQGDYTTSKSEKKRGHNEARDVQVYGKMTCCTRNDPLPTKPDGGLDWSEITAVMNLAIVDYHE
jgi:hypothetical protein